MGVLTVILTVFTAAVRFTFSRSLNQQLNIRLENLAKAAAFNMDNEDGELDVDDDEILVGQEQTIKWFGLEGERIAQQGEYELNFPLNIEQLSEIQNHPNSIRSLTIPVYNLKNEKDGVDNKLDDNAELDELIDEISDQVKDDLDEEIERVAAEILEEIDDALDELADDIAEELDNNIDESTIAEIVQEVAEELGEETYEEIAEELTGQDLDEIEDDDADEEDEIDEIVDEIEDDLDEIAEDIGEEIKELASEEQTEEIVKKLIKNITEAIGEKLTEEIAEEQTEKIAEVIGEDEAELIGYVRVSQSLSELDNTLRRLDYGLGSGMAISLLLSGLGSLWLTRRAMQPIEASFERLKQFTADASHELRSPLMAIKTNADVALKYPDGMRATDAEKFEAIASATNQMTRLTENLLLLARTARVNTLQKEPVDISSILSDLMQLYSPQAREQGMIWQEKLEKDLYLLGDEALLRQLFTNLLQNALHYTPAGGSVLIEASRANSKFIVIKVRDTGIGIAPEHLDQIFERFWRLDKSRSYQAGKSGLGLAIAREIVQLHRGTIVVESQLGVGSCFTVRFPVKASLN